MIDLIDLAFDKPWFWRFRRWLAARLGVERGAITAHSGRLNFYNIDFDENIRVRRVGGGLLIMPDDDEDLALLDTYVERAQTPERLLN